MGAGRRAQERAAASADEKVRKAHEEHDEEREFCALRFGVAGFGVEGRGFGTRFFLPSSPMTGAPLDGDAAAGPGEEAPECDIETSCEEDTGVEGEKNEHGGQGGSMRDVVVEKRRELTETGSSS
eukprot:2793022-Rhodomonas_salina.2